MNTLSIDQGTFKPFFQLSSEAIKKLWETNLTGNDWKVYSFLSLLDPFGDRWCELPSIKDICTLLEMSKTSFYRAMTKLRDGGIIDAKVKGVMFQNLLGSAKMNPDSQKRNASTKNVTAVTDIKPESQIRENRELKPREDKGSSVSQTLQTSHISLDSSYPDGEGQKESEQETGQPEDIGEDKGTNTNPSSQNLKSETQASTSDLKEDKNSGGCSMDEGSFQIVVTEKPILKTTKQNSNGIDWDWLPEGVWKKEGKLDGDFLEWVASDYIKRYGETIESARSNAQICFFNNPQKLPVYWKRYHEEYLSKLKNTDTLLNHGVKIKDDRREQTIKRVRAVLPVAEEQSVAGKETPVDSNSIKSLGGILNSLKIGDGTSSQNILKPVVTNED
jgi:hypothetical protein